MSSLSSSNPFPSLIHITLQPNTPPETLIETLSILSILITRFPSNLSATSIEPLNVLAPLLDHQRPVVRKRAIITIAQFIPTSKPDLFDNLLEAYVYPHILNTATIVKQRTTVQLVAAIARHSASHIAPVLSAIVPGILGAIQREDDELRESGLQVHSSSSTDRITSIDVIYLGARSVCAQVSDRDHTISQFDHTDCKRIYQIRSSEFVRRMHPPSKPNISILELRRGRRG